MTQHQKDVESVTNQFGATLSEIMQVSSSLHDLLSDELRSHNDGRLKEDMATIAKLRYWRFNEDDICDILMHYRSRGRDKKAIGRIVQKTTLTEINSIPSPLGRALTDSSKDNNGRPKVGVNTLREIQIVFNILGETATVSKIIDSGFPKGNSKEGSAKRRVQRGLKILEQAGYVSRKEVGQLYIWYNEELSSLSLPEYPQEDVVLSN